MWEQDIMLKLPIPKNVGGTKRMKTTFTFGWDSIIVIIKLYDNSDKYFTWTSILHAFLFFKKNKNI